MKARTRGLLAMVLASITALSMMGCQSAKGSANDPAPTASAKTEVTTPATETKSPTVVKHIGFKIYDPVYVAIDKGFFDDSVIDVQLVDTVAGGPSAIEMVATGEAHSAVSSIMAITNAVDAGMPVIGVTDVQSAFSDVPLEEFYVRDDSDIHSVEDLRGKKIAINLVKSSFHYTWLIALKNAGMTEEDVTFITLSFAEQEEALMNGTVDAIGVLQPYSGKARRNPELRQLYNACDAFGARQFSDIFMNTEWLAKNPEAAKAYVEGIAKACDWIKDNQAEAKTIIEAHTGIDAGLIDDYRFQNDAAVIMDDHSYWLKYMQENEGVSSSLTVDKIATNEYNTRVK